MMQQLKKYIDSIDAMALRERVLFFLAVALVLMTLLQVFLIDPVLARRNQLAAQIMHQNDEARAMQAQIQSLIRPEAPDQDAINRDKIRALRADMEQIDRQFEAQQKQFVAPAKMAAMLEGMVVKNGKLRLLSLRNLAPTGIADASAGAAPAAAGTAAPAAPGAAARAPATQTVYRHAVEISVSGSYFDLLDYVDALEHLPQQVFWDAIELRTAQYPQSVLTLTIYTISTEKSWLTV